MKTLRITAAGLMLAAATALASCGSQPTNTDPPAAEALARPAAYFCPMECEGSASDKPGKCPVCGMALEKNPAYKAPGTDSL